MARSSEQHKPRTTQPLSLPRRPTHSPTQFAIYSDRAMRVESGSVVRTAEFAARGVSRAPATLFGPGFVPPLISCTSTHFAACTLLLGLSEAMPAQLGDSRSEERVGKEERWSLALDTT